MLFSFQNRAMAVVCNECMSYADTWVMITHQKSCSHYKAAQHRMHLTAIAVGVLCGLAGFFVGWLVFAC